MFTGSRLGANQVTTGGPDTEEKLAPEIAATFSVILAGSVIGRLTMGWLADRWAKKHVMLLIYVIVIAVLLLRPRGLFGGAVA